MRTIRWQLYRWGIALKDKGERTGRVWMIRAGYLLIGRIY